MKLMETLMDEVTIIRAETGTTVELRRALKADDNAG
jgi:hypothetical protein